MGGEKLKNARREFAKAEAMPVSAPVRILAHLVASTEHYAGHKHHTDARKFPKAHLV
jgi:hypothetical protein